MYQFIANDPGGFTPGWMSFAPSIFDELFVNSLGLGVAKRNPDVYL
jgi:hypothetical protein